MKYSQEMKTQLWGTAVKRNRSFITIPLQGSLDTETPEEIMQQKSFQTLTNFYSKNGVLKKRGVLTAQSTAISAGTFTGLVGYNFQGTDTLFRMYNNAGNNIDKRTTGSWSNIATGLTNSDTLRWGSTKFYYNNGEVIIFTNNNDDLQVYNGTTTVTLSSLSSSTQRPSKAKLVLELDGYLLAFNIVQADGATVYNNRIRWCNAFDLTVWTDADYQDILSAGQILGAVRFNTEIYVFMENSIARITPTGNENAPFSFTYSIVPYGTKWNQSIVDFKNRLLFAGSDYSIRAFDGFKSIFLTDSVKTLFSTSPTIESAAYDDNEAQYILQLGSDILTLDLGTPVNTEIETLSFSKETYASGITMLTTLAGVPYGCQGLNVVKLHDTGTQDLATTSVSSDVITGRFILGDRIESKVGKVRIYGKETSGTGTTTVTVTYYPTESTVSSSINLSPNGTDIEINMWARQLKFEIANTAAQSIRIDKIEVEILNSRKY